MLLYTVLLSCLVARAQLPVASSLGQLAHKSDAVIVAVVQSKAWVVRPEKMLIGQKTHPNGNVEVPIPNPRDYVVGSLYNVRVEQILKNDNGVRTRRTLRVFIPGFMASAHEGAALVPGERYLVFLERLNSRDGTFSDTRVHTPETKSANVENFDPNSSFTIVQSGNAAVQITKKNLAIIRQVQALLRP